MELAGPQGAGAALPVSSRGSGGAHAKVVRAPGLVREEDATQGPRTSPETGGRRGGARQGPGLEAGKQQWRPGACTMYLVFTP